MVFVFLALIPRPALIVSILFLLNELELMPEGDYLSETEERGWKEEARSKEPQGFAGER